jgi:hypothetical protein
MYLIIYEDGNFEYTATISDDYLKSCTDGYMELIDVSDPLNLLYFGFTADDSIGKWVKVKELKVTA